MWKRKELKARGKSAFKTNYWACVLASVILLTMTVGSFTGAAILTPKSAGISAALNTLPVNATGDEVSDTEAVEDIEDIEDIDINELINALSDSSSESSSITDILNGIDPSALAGIALIALMIILIAVVVTVVIRIIIYYPIQVSGYQFFKENALEKASGLKFEFNNEYKNIVLGMFVRDIFLVLWSLLFVIPGIIKSYSYRMVPFILTDNPGIGAADAITLSRKMMKGNKWKAFVLDLSFLGWNILSALTCGILGIFYVNPYTYATEAELYHAIKPVGQQNG